MPDFERPLRSLEHHAAATPEQKAYVAGKHEGEDKARIRRGSRLSSSQPES